MSKIKVITVVGTRPEIIRLSAVINLLNSTESIHHVLIHTGQNYDYELNEVFFNDLEIKRPDYFLEAATGDAIETISNILEKLNPILEKENPDAFLILGDTNSCLSAIVAKKHKIPIFHMEAGNRCFDQRVPEETNRKIVDHIADINMPYSSIAREYLLNEGFPADRIIKTGSPMYEVLKSKIKKINESNILNKLKLTKNEYILVSAHREENINSSNFSYLIDSLNSIAEIYNIPIIISTHPRTKKMIDRLNVNFNNNIKTIKPLGFIDYNKLQMDSKIVLSDSGTISEESSILKFKALNIREAHERPEAMEEAAVMMVGVKKDRILQAISFIELNSNMVNQVYDYSLDYVSHKVVKIILSYIDYINKNVWKKE